MPRYPKKVTLYHVDHAAEELELVNRWNPGAYNVRLVRNRLEFHLLGGRVLTWPPEQEEEPEPARPARKKKEPES